SALRASTSSAGEIASCSGICRSSAWRWDAHRLAEKLGDSSQPLSTTSRASNTTQALIRIIDLPEVATPQDIASTIAQSFFARPAQVRRLPHGSHPYQRGMILAIDITPM